MLLFLLAGVGLVLAFFGYRQQDWTIIMIAATANLVLIASSVVLKLLGRSAPD
jgi:hypothetical protein